MVVVVVFGGKTPQKRICKSAPSGCNYSGTLLKSATRQREKIKRGADGGGEESRERAREAYLIL